MLLSRLITCLIWDQKAVRVVVRLLPKVHLRWRRAPIHSPVITSRCFNLFEQAYGSASKQVIFHGYDYSLLARSDIALAEGSRILLTELPILGTCLCLEWSDLKSSQRRDQVSRVLRQCYTTEMFCNAYYPVLPQGQMYGQLAQNEQSFFYHVLHKMPRPACTFSRFCHQGAVDGAPCDFRMHSRHCRRAPLQNRWLKSVCL
eukprot:284815111_5